MGWPAGFQSLRSPLSTCKGVCCVASSDYIRLTEESGPSWGISKANRKHTTLQDISIFILCYRIPNRGLHVPAWNEQLTCSVQTWSLDPVPFPEWMAALCSKALLKAGRQQQAELAKTRPLAEVALPSRHAADVYPTWQHCWKECQAELGKAQKNQAEVAAPTWICAAQHGGRGC